MHLKEDFFKIISGPLYSFLFNSEKKLKKVVLALNKLIYTYLWFSLVVYQTVFGIGIRISFLSHILSSVVYQAKRKMSVGQTHNF